MIENLVVDCDGTLTDGKYYYTKEGKIAKRELSETKGATRYDKHIFIIGCVLIGGFFFIKSLLCIIDA